MRKYTFFSKISILLVLLALLGLSLGCTSPKASSQATESFSEADNEDNAQVERRETTVGPVQATVSLKPINPTLGDHVTLTLEVRSQPDVIVHMPAFGEQLGRFNIVDYVPRESVNPDGGSLYTQVYTLDLPMSGKQRIPSLLVEFEDQRANAENGSKIQELLTEEFSFSVISLLPEGEIVSELAPARPLLPELVLPSAEKTPWLGLTLGTMATIGLLIGFIAYRRRKHQEIILPPDEIALNALQDLENASYPETQEGVDAWFVTLSGIVRAYIEARFDLDAPKLTTEEFFELANSSDLLTQPQKASLRRILDKSDRVKFATYRPEAQEALEALAAARAFVEETRVKPENVNV